MSSLEIETQFCTREGLKKNFTLLRAITEAGYSSPYHFAKQEGINSSSLYDLINMAALVVDQDGHIRNVIWEICEALDCLPDQIFPISQFRPSERARIFASRISKEKMQEFLFPNGITYDMEEVYEISELEKYIKNAMKTLNYQEMYVLKRRYGLEENEKEASLDEVADEIFRTRERVRQIEKKALKKMKLPYAADCLEGYVPND